MGMPELYAKIEEAIVQSRLQYEKDKDDSYLSTIRAEELRILQYLYERLKSGESRENLLTEMKEELPVLKARREDEIERPTFYWYDEHHHFKLLDGQCDAYRIMIDLLECGV